MPSAKKTQVGFLAVTVELLQNRRNLRIARRLLLLMLRLLNYYLINHPQTYE